MTTTINRLETQGPGVSGGFTLIEMIMVLAIMLVLLLVAIPGYRQLVLNNQMISDSYGLRATLNNARSEAMARRASVVVCPTSNGTSCNATNNWMNGYMSFVDTDGDGAPDSTDRDEEIIQHEPNAGTVRIIFSNASNLVRFLPQGTALNSAGTFTFCDERGATDARALILNPVGSVSSAVDEDDPADGIVNIPGGSNVGC